MYYILSAGLPFYVVWLCYKEERANPVRHRKIMNQKFNQFCRLAKKVLLISSTLTIVTERGVERKGFQLSVVNFSNCTKEKIFRLHKSYRFLLNKNFSQFIFILFKIAYFPALFLQAVQAGNYYDLFSLLQIMLARTH